MQVATSKKNERGGGAHLRELWNFLLRNRLLTVGVPLLLVAATAVFVWTAVPTYDATVWVRIDEEKSNLPVLDALKDLSSGGQLGTEMQVLRRRPLAEAVVDSLALQVVLTRPRGVSRSELFTGVHVSREAPEGEYRLHREAGGRFAVERIGGESAPSSVGVGETLELDGARLVLSRGALEHEEIRLVVRPFRDAVKEFRESLEVSRPDREADIVVVRYQGADRELVRAVPNTLAELFIVERQRVKKSQASGTVAFLVERLDTLEAHLRDAEDQVRAFRERENVVSLEYEGKASIDRLAKLQAERDLLDAERAALAKLLSEVAAVKSAPGDPSPYRRLIAFPSLLKNFAVSELFRSLAEVENTRAELLNRRTEADPDVAVLSGRIHDLEEQLRYISVTYLEGLTNHVNSLNGVLAGFRTELGQVPAREVSFARLQRRAEVLQEIYTLLQTRLQEAQIVAAVDDRSVRVVEPAALPVDPIKPNKRLSLVLALVLGVVLGGGIAFVRENMDNTIHTREDLHAVVDEVPVLGLIPRIRVATAGDKAAVGIAMPGLEARLVAGRDPRSPVSEAYRSLRTNISFSRMGESPRSLVFTSPTPGDGKSTSAANLAITLAQQGLRCLLVDADMRRGLLNETFKVRREPGLSNVILGRAALESAVVKLELGESGTLDFLPTGTVPPNPAELLASAQMQKLLEQLAARYDTVILDAPPLTLVTDAALLGSYADGVVLVARAGVTDRGAVTYALEQLRAVRAPILGAVLNDVDQKKEQYYGSYSAGAHASYYGAPVDG
jgi:tyrosine-protein kinase Etk/Wzc